MNYWVCQSITELSDLLNCKSYLHSLSLEISYFPFIVQLTMWSDKHIFQIHNHLRNVIHYSESYELILLMNKIIHNIS